MPLSLPKAKLVAHGTLYKATTTSRSTRSRQTEMLKDYCNGVWKTMRRSPAPHSEQNEYIVKLRSMLRLANGRE